ncbi:rRNA maturation RNase YbeY [uncultured Sanguibacteroides sp.]|uniref:rRNA maturation RNase YbeY n=1 Tax=uncultured Sanguibacteroides sp. TaxID=1635151 RepID=UPI0025DC4771|nr:rRNA maturation RNase YbeY [uncultured Sanguibacteroides sp.]
MSEIFFFNEGCELPPFLLAEKIKKWLDLVASDYSCCIGTISFIFCDDSYILNVNQKYLNHDYYTDVITFDYRENDILSGDVFISLDTVRSNASEFNTTFENELNRVIVHSVLHLIGFKDKTDEDAKLMRKNEDHCLELLKTL